LSSLKATGKCFKDAEKKILKKNSQKSKKINGEKQILELGKTPEQIHFLKKSLAKNIAKVFKFQKHS
jgi:hypothetical protein